MIAMINCTIWGTLAVSSKTYSGGKYGSDFIRLRNDVSIPKPRREKVYDAIRKILDERGLNEPEAW